MPTACCILLIVGLIFLLLEGAVSKILGVIILGFCYRLYYEYDRNKIKEKYGMAIYTNDRERTILVSKKKDFIIEVIRELYEVMNDDEDRVMNFNFQDCDISDRSVKIGHNSASPVVSGRVEGDVVNNIN